MRLALNLAIVKSLRLEERPVSFDAKGKLVYVANPRLDPYFVWDSSPGAPEGFGVKVAKRKTFIVQRKVAGRTMRSSLGSVAEFAGADGMDKARQRAAEIAAEMVAKGVNPTVERRKKLASEITLGDAFEAYEKFITERENKRATTETLRTFQKVKRKFADWASRKIIGLTPEDILARYDAGSAFPSANEQAFKTAYGVVQHQIEVELLHAATAKREPLLGANPFAILRLKGKYRSSAQIERERQEKMKRNPLSPSETLGKFLAALWAKRMATDERNKVGCSYLLLTLIVGARKSECAQLKWAEMLTDAERLTNSHVDLDNNKVFFFKTKNKLDHLLPLPPMMKRMLEGLQKEAAHQLSAKKADDKKRFYVFPARNKFSSKGHYSDAQDLLDRIREIAGIPVLTRHDLRRSFGTVLASLEAPESISRRFLNHSQAQTHNRYTKAEWALMEDWMRRIEEAILVKCPAIYNALKPAGASPLPEQPLPEIPPDKPRTGRPKKNAEAH